MELKDGIFFQKSKLSVAFQVAFRQNKLYILLDTSYPLLLYTSYCTFV